MSHISPILRDTHEHIAQMDRIKETTSINYEIIGLHSNKNDNNSNEIATEAFSMSLS